jgi:hypothetical protein
MADPAKGHAYALGQGAKTSQEMKDKQREYHDKKDMLYLNLDKEMAKEKDASARGDADAVNAAVSAQKQTQLKIAELDIKAYEGQARMISANASASNAATESNLSGYRSKLLEAQTKEAEAQAKKHEAEITTPEEKAKIAREKAEDTRNKNVNEAVHKTLTEKGGIYDRWSETMKPKEAGGRGYGPETENGKAVASYLDQYRSALNFALKNNIPFIAPPEPTLTEKEVPTGKTGWFDDKTEKKKALEYTPKNPYEPIPIPPNAKPENLIKNKIYITKKGPAIWNGKEFVEPR